MTAVTQGNEACTHHAAETNGLPASLQLGLEGLSDADVVALLLGAQADNEPAGEVVRGLLNEVGGPGGLTRWGLGALTAWLGPTTGTKLAAAVELGRRISLEATKGASPRLGDARAVEAWARPRLAALDHEELWLLALDGQAGLRSARRVAMGGLHGVPITVRDPLRVALREGASAFVLVHNHPSGDPRPSDEDIDFTRKLETAGWVVGVPLVDHVIVSRQGAVSMLNTGLLSDVPLPWDGL